LRGAALPAGGNGATVITGARRRIRRKKSLPYATTIACGDMQVTLTGRGADDVS
jgi:hypothetical protein